MTHFVEVCGLPIITYFSAVKLLWLMENVDAVKKAVKLYRTGEYTIKEIEEMTGVKKSTLYRYLKS